MHKSNCRRPRTGVRIYSTFVEFELKEEIKYHRIQVEQTAVLSKRGRKVELAPSDIPHQETRHEQILAMYITTANYGQRQSWRDGLRRKLEEHLPEFLDGLHAVADVKRKQEEKHQSELNRKRILEDRSRRIMARIAKEARRSFDLESRIADWEKAQSIRQFVSQVRLSVKEGPPAEGLEGWITWAIRKAEKLETSSIYTLGTLRPMPKTEDAPPSIHHEESDSLRHQVDLWRRRYIYARR
jgi:hypothetical protein